MGFGPFFNYIDQILPIMDHQYLTLVNIGKEFLIPTFSVPPILVKNDPWFEIANIMPKVFKIHFINFEFKFSKKSREIIIKYLFKNVGTSFKEQFESILLLDGKINFSLEYSKDGNTTWLMRCGKRKSRFVSTYAVLRGSIKRQGIFFLWKKCNFCAKEPAIA